MKKKTPKWKSKDVKIAVTQKDYDRAMRSMVKPDETFRPGVYHGRRGGFLERHPEALTKKIVRPEDGICPGRRYSITPFPKFPDLPGMENRAHFFYASVGRGRLAGAGNIELNETFSI